MKKIALKNKQFYSITENTETNSLSGGISIIVEPIDADQIVEVTDEAAEEIKKDPKKLTDMIK